jgi:hypothetical protein
LCPRECRGEPCLAVVGCCLPFDLYLCQLLIKPSETLCQGRILLSLLFDFNLMFQRISKTNILELTIVVLPIRDKGLILAVDLEAELVPSFADKISFGGAFL